MNGAAGSTGPGDAASPPNPNPGPAQQAPQPQPQGFQQQAPQPQPQGFQQQAPQPQPQGFQQQAPQHFGYALFPAQGLPHQPQDNPASSGAAASSASTTPAASATASSVGAASGYLQPGTPAAMHAMQQGPFGYQMHMQMPHPTWAQYGPQLPMAGPSMSASPWNFQSGDSTVQAAKSPATIIYEPTKDQCAICLGYFFELRMFEPCNHMPYCSDCLRSIARTKNNRVWCPVCNLNQTRTMEVKKMVPRK